MEELCSSDVVDGFDKISDVYLSVLKALVTRLTQATLDTPRRSQTTPDRVPRVPNQSFNPDSPKEVPKLDISSFPLVSPRLTKKDPVVRNQSSFPGSPQKVPRFRSPQSLHNYPSLPSVETLGSSPAGKDRVSTVPQCCLLRNTPKDETETRQ
ncbi:hypothetical protein O3P69_012505 [Scylla paramamosain]|uniref:Uncharacterized protein n=1 Tax=Scylla paramamosain TaxID=85552 RepID=A0AAW0SGF5_SCYPA